MKSQLTFTVLFVLLSQIFTLSVCAQIGEASSKSYEDLGFIDALEIYANVAEQDMQNGIENVALYLRLANSYYYNGEYRKAATWYGRYYDNPSVRPTPIENYRYGQVLKALGAYRQADSLLVTYYDYKGLRYTPYDQKEIPLADNSDRYKKRAYGLNSDFNEYPGLLVGNRLYVISTDTGKKTRHGRTPTSDIFYVDLDAVDQRLEPLPGEVNSPYNEGPLAITADGMTLYFSRNNYLKERIGHNKNDVVTIDLYRAENVNGSWKKITALPFNNTEYSVGHPALSPDGKTLYFSSDKPGGKGQTDLYQVPLFDDGSFGSPKNMAALNTLGKEMFPFVDSDGVIYFASDRQESMGGLDLFMAPLEADGSYHRVYHTGQQINSRHDDFAYTINANGIGFFGSNRQGDVSGDDIHGVDEQAKYRFPVFVSLEGSVTALEGPMPVQDARLTLFDTDDQVIASASTDAKGYYRFDQTAARKLAYIRVEKDGYQIREKTIPQMIREGQVSELHLKLRPQPDGYADTITVFGTLKDLNSGQPLANAEVTIFDIHNKALASQRTAADGSYQVHNLPTRQLTGVRARTPNYQIEEKAIESDAIISSAVQVDFLLTKGTIPIELGGDLSGILNPIYFDFGKSEIRADAEIELKKIIEALKRYPTIKIEIGSHTDSRGSHAANLALSKRRALATYRYLIAYGITKERLQYKGYGETRLINDCTDGHECPEHIHQFNRRSSFVITSH